MRGWLGRLTTGVNDRHLFSGLEVSKGLFALLGKAGGITHLGLQGGDNIPLKGNIGGSEIGERIGHWVGHECSGVRVFRCTYWRQGYVISLFVVKI